MPKGVPILIFIMLWLIVPLDSVFAYTYSGGKGGPNKPYLIATAEDMNSIGAHPNDWDKHFLLVNDINLADYTGTQFNIIGPNSTTPFAGVFDGNDHAILNFTYDSNGLSYVGLFGYIRDVNACVKHLKLLNPNIKAGSGSYVSALVGRLHSGSITGCQVYGSKVAGDRRVGTIAGAEGYYSSPAVISDCTAFGQVSGRAFCGGIAGTADCSVTNCFSGCDVSGDFEIGGLIGYNTARVFECRAMGNISGNDYIGGLIGWNNGRVAASSATSSVTGRGEYCGGLIGWNDYVTVLSHCYAQGDVNGVNYVGGLTGGNFTRITQCYATGLVTGDNFIGALVGEQESGFSSYSSCFWDNTVNGSLTGIGNGEDLNVIGQSTFNLHMASTFIDAGWDFVDQNDGPCDIWSQPNEGGYPILWWQLPQLPELPNFSGGKGTQSEPYLISTLHELESIGYNPRLMSRHFSIVSDIDLLGTQFDIIGSEGFPFEGAFDGNEHVIRNFTWDSNNSDYVGFFSYATGNAIIENLILADVNIQAGNGDHVGALVGYSDSYSHCFIYNCRVSGGVSGGHDVGGLFGCNYGRGTISDCVTNIDVSATGSRIGGLVGYSESAITKCSATCDVIGVGNVGGLAGVTRTVSQCSSIGSVTGSGYSCGGLVGQNIRTVLNSYSDSQVFGYREVGGLIGKNRGIRNCYSTGSVIGESSVGGLVGYDSGLVVSSFWDVNTSGQSESAGGTGLTTEQMQMQSTFVNAGWDFVSETINGPNDIWDICEETNYPRLVWQIPLTDLFCPDGVNFIDYSFFTDHWKDIDCADANDCDGTDVDFSGAVDMMDLKIFCQHWLLGTH